MLEIHTSSSSAGNMRVHSHRAEEGSGKRYVFTSSHIFSLCMQIHVTFAFVRDLLNNFSL